MTYNILAIDDEEICLEVIEMFLETKGYNVLPALGGAKGLQILKSASQRIDIIMLDLMMPDLAGIEVLKIIREDPKFRLIPVILQTGSSNDTELEKANSIGITTYVRKPYDCEDLFRAISEVMTYSEATNSILN